MNGITSSFAPLDATAAFADYLEHLQQAVEAELIRTLPEEWEVPAILKESMTYSLMAGGKRLRPVLAIAAAEAVGGNPEAAFPAAIAVELIHTYSLIHDDLPAMDNDDLRRGKPTNHKVFGEAMAILAGDALLTHAFYQLVQSYTKYGVSAEQTLGMVKELSMYAGPRGMVGGQTADILAEQGVTDIGQLEYIHLHKTSDLIVFPLRAGGRAGGASDTQLGALQTFGMKLGLAFQIQDDVLDLIGDEQKLGKPLKSDEKSSKVTYPFFIGIDGCRKLISKLTEEAKQALTAGGFPAPGRLFQLADYLVHREY